MSLAASTVTSFCADRFDPLVPSLLDSAAAARSVSSSSSYMTMVCRVLAYRLEASLYLSLAAGSEPPKSMLWLAARVLVFVGEVSAARYPAADFRFPSGDPDCIFCFCFAFYVLITSLSYSFILFQIKKE